MICAIPRGDHWEVRCEIVFKDGRVIAKISKASTLQSGLKKASKAVTSIVCNPN
jgi:hypothetical protein